MSSTEALIWYLLTIGLFVILLVGGTWEAMHAHDDTERDDRRHRQRQGRT